MQERGGKKGDFSLLATGATLLAHSKTMQQKCVLVVGVVLTVVLASSITTVAATADASGRDLDQVKKLLREGDKLLLKGRSSYQDAIAQYSTAISMDETHVNAWLRRADLFYMMKNTEDSTRDLNHALELDPRNRQGLMLRAKQNAAVGHLLDAARDHEVIAQIHAEKNDQKKSEKAALESHELRALGNRWAEIEARFERIEKLFPGEKIELGKECMPIVQDIITRYAKDHMAMRVKKAECALMAHDPATAADAIKMILTKQPDNLAAIAMNARSLRGLGAVDSAKKEVRRCLGLDPEFKPCVAAHKAIKAFGNAFGKLEKAANAGLWQEVPELVKAARGVERDPPNLEEMMKWWCKSHVENKDLEGGYAACEEALEVLGGEKNPQNMDNIIAMADLFFMAEDLESAEKWVQRAQELQTEQDRVRGLKEKLERLKAAAARKNYYKILGIKKSATSKEVHRAFRKMARDRHPDRLRSREDLTERQKERMSKEFTDINEAKEILLDADKRRRYDQGEDPTKPEGQQGGHHHHHHQQHHHHGGFPFGGQQQHRGGGFNFHHG